jgi:hypothetical protein
MTLLRTLCITLSIILGLTAAAYSTPYTTSKGTAVISSISNDQDGNIRLTTVVVSDNLSIEQQKLLGFAYDVAKADGMLNPTYLQGILLQESNACHGKSWRVAGLTNRVGNRYFGCGQIKVAAARGVLDQFPEMRRFLNTDTDEEIQARLILDDEFNIRVASKYLLMMGINDNPARAITAYNVGPGAVRRVNPKHHDYTKRVQHFSKRMKNVQIDDARIEWKGKDNLILASEP